MGNMRIGSFQVLGTLGQGAHSTILHIRRSADGKQYALKIVPVRGQDDLKYVEQAEHEFRVSQRLHHPNLIKVHALEKRFRWLFWGLTEVRLLIEFVRGKTLDQVPLLPVVVQVQIFTRVADGLAHMHRRGVFHADLKPANILFGPNGQVKIIDYGLAWIEGQHKARIQGTPEYMAPEQLKHRLVNEKTDMFNFGATMYRLLTVRHIPPLIGPSGLALDARNWENALKRVEQLNPDVPKALGDLVHRCLAYHPHKRPETMSEVHQALQELEQKLVQSDADRLDVYEV